MLKKIKKKKCKQCGKEFTPANSLVKVCGYRCMMKIVKVKKKVRLTKAKELVKDYKKLAWKEFSWNLRHTAPKDKDGNVQCYTCLKPIKPEEADSGHFHHNKMDYSTKNIRVQCTYCNQHLHGNLSVYRANLIAEYGAVYVEQLDRESENCEPIKKYQHKEIYEKYKLLNKELNDN